MSSLAQYSPWHKAYAAFTGGFGFAAKGSRRIEGCGARKIRPVLSTEVFHGIDPDHRCTTAAVWRRRRILWSQSRLLVIEGSAGDRARTYAGGFSIPMRYPMSDFERLLVPGCTELPACRCGTEMDVARTYSLAGKIDTHIRVYDCPACHHEMHLTVWGADAGI
jgi:hypothetical protein